MLRTSTAAVVAFIPLLVGCWNAAGDRLPLSGKIIGGEGKNGSISLIPQGDNSGPSAVGEIKEGAYQFDASNGPHAGKHLARILLDLGNDPKTASENPKVFTGRGPSPLGPQFGQYDVQVDVPAAEPYQLDITIGAASGS